jgi:hypothetical protein
MQFQVPQFLDVEDKVIGPLTIKQFLYLAGGAGLGYLTYKIIPWFTIAVIPALGFFILGGMLAFYKHNNKPFIFLVESAFNYSQSSRLYVWRRREKVGQVSLALDLTNFTPTKHAGVGIPLATSGSKLNDLTWTIDVKKENEVASGSDKIHMVNL